MKPLILYGTQACHLCEQAEQQLQQWLTRMPGRFELVTIDIVENDTLVEHYGVRIPVVIHPETGRELGWPFDVDALHAFLV